MSNLDAVTKVADQIVSRIFDQRQFTGGEINFLVKELGEKVDLTENFDKLLKINENVCMISDTSREDMCSAQDATRQTLCDQDSSFERRLRLYQSNFSHLYKNRQVTSLVARTESILSRANGFRESNDKILEEKRAELDRRKQACMRDCNMKLEKFREFIVGEELELERKYLKFEENLRNKKL